MVQYDLRASKYNFEAQSESGELVLYNSKTGAIALIEPERAPITLAVLRNPNAHKADSEIKQQLTDMSFLVREGTDELADIRAWYERYSRADNMINLVLLPAEACNFKCPYCFVYSHRNKFMAQRVYDAVFAFLKARFLQQADDGLNVSLSWFGGEPLLAMSDIVTFMNRVNSLGHKDKFIVQSSIVTNGYTLNAAALEALIECGVNQFQVTLDGEKNTHDQLRMLKSGKPTFDVIYSNLLEISELDASKRFSLIVRGNFLRPNIESMMRLLERFQADFGSDERFSIYFRPVYHFKTERTDIDTLSTDICTLREGIVLQNKLAIATMKASPTNQYLRMFDPLPKPTFSWCPAERENSFIVGADGSIFLCDSLITDASERLGVIDRDGQILFNEAAAPWRLSVFQDERCAACLECKLLPICLGGCIRIRIQAGSPACFWTEDDIREAMLQYPVSDAGAMLDG